MDELKDITIPVRIGGHWQAPSYRPRREGAAQQQQGAGGEGPQGGRARPENCWETRPTTRDEGAADQRSRACSNSRLPCLTIKSPPQCGLFAVVKHGVMGRGWVSKMRYYPGSHRNREPGGFMNKRVLITGGGRGIGRRQPAIWRRRVSSVPQLSSGEGVRRGGGGRDPGHPSGRVHRGAGGCRRGGRGGAPVRGDGRAARPRHPPGEQRRQAAAADAGAGDERRAHQPDPDHQCHRLLSLLSRGGAPHDGGAPSSTSLPPLRAWAPREYVDYAAAKGPSTC